MPRSSQFPSWFLSQPEGLVGIGIAPYSGFNPQSSFEKAFEYAVEDVNSNHFSVVTIEQFRQAGVEQFQEEIGISDEFNSANVIKLDSMVIGDWVFMLVGVSPLQVDASQQFISNKAPISIPASEVVLTSNETLARGVHQTIISNPYKAWALSKQSAFKRLGFHTAIKVQAVQKIYNEDLENVSYLKSRVALKNIKVVSRWIENGELQTLIEVENSNIVNLVD